MTNVVLSGLPGTEARAWLGAKAEPYREHAGGLAGLPPGAPDLTGAIAAGSVTLDIPIGQQAIVFPVNAGGVVQGQAKLVMAGFTRTVPVLDSLSPASMASGSGDKTLTIFARGVSRSARLHFGAAGTPEPVRLDPNGNPTTIIKTGLWAPGAQPVWITNAGMKSNVLTFTFT